MRSELQEVFDHCASGMLTEEEARDILGLSMARILSLRVKE